MNMFRAFMELDKINEGIFDIPKNRSNWVSMKSGQSINLNNNTQAAKQPASIQSTKKYALALSNPIGINDYDFMKLETCGLWAGEVTRVDRLTASTGLFNTVNEAVTAAQYLFNTGCRPGDIYIAEYDAKAGTVDIIQTINKKSTNKYIVTIVSHGGRLRALATDGIHPAGWVAFPNNLRQFEGQKYEVDQLIWNGKNYRVAGNIVKI